MSVRGKRAAVAAALALVLLVAWFAARTALARVPNAHASMTATVTVGENEAAPGMALVDEVRRRGATIGRVDGDFVALARVSWSGLEYSCQPTLALRPPFQWQFVAAGGDIRVATGTQWTDALTAFGLDRQYLQVSLAPQQSGTALVLLSLTESYRAEALDTKGVLIDLCDRHQTPIPLTVRLAG